MNKRKHFIYGKKQNRQPFLIIKGIFLLLFLGFPLLSNSLAPTSQEQNQGNLPRKITILGLGDSITEGGENFQSYLFPLKEKLSNAGFNVDFIGPRTSNLESKEIKCAGYSGKNAEFLNEITDSIYQKYPADIVLLHAGHNHFKKENPVPGIVRSQESIIHRIRSINPDVKILVAQVIPSGKLPKYGYIPELNKAIAKMVRQQKNKNVLLVNQAKAFTWQRYTINDHVHPNEAGAEKMAKTWFQKLKRILPPAPAYNAGTLINN